MKTSRWKRFLHHREPQPSRARRPSNDAYGKAGSSTGADQFSWEEHGSSSSVTIQLSALIAQLLGRAGRLTHEKRALIHDLLMILHKSLKLASTQCDNRVTLRKYDETRDALTFDDSFPPIQDQAERDNLAAIPCNGPKSKSFVISKVFREKKVPHFENAQGHYPHGVDVWKSLRNVLAAAVSNYTDSGDVSDPLGTVSCDLSSYIEDSNLNGAFAKDLAQQVAFLIYNVATYRY